MVDENCIYKFDWNTKLFFCENALEDVICIMAAILSRGRWVNHHRREYSRGIMAGVWQEFEYISVKENISRKAWVTQRMWDGSGNWIKTQPLSIQACPHSKLDTSSVCPCPDISSEKPWFRHCLFSKPPFGFLTVSWSPRTWWYIILYHSPIGSSCLGERGNRIW